MHAKIAIKNTEHVFSDRMTIEGFGTRIITLSNIGTQFSRTKNFCPDLKRKIIQ